MNILEKIIAVKRDEIALLKKEVRVREYDELDLFYKPSISLIETIKNTNDISIIAEIKKASPSKGVINEDFDHLAIGKAYLANGADAISILTDEKFFQGSIKYLADIARIKTKPLLRKDFIIDEIQILQAKENGADAILLICEALSKTEVRKLTLTAQSMGLEVLLELHSAKQLDKIDPAIHPLVGVNNRDLESFKVDLKVTEKIRKLIPDDILLVSESGINSADDIKMIRNSGCDAILAGEHFMRSNSIAESLNEMKSWCRR
ncbi:MAG: indole-3-glycerol phosphate synthase TrpC [Bacteroidetes bacterium]|nr:indole-3-glycerol phosphate synthase TrpC [Bacteroidota bacterium]